MQMELFKHQSESLDQTKDFNRVAYYLDMGLGKTFVGSEKMKQLGTDLNILVCQKSKVENKKDIFLYAGHTKAFDEVKNVLLYFIDEIQ